MKVSAPTATQLEYLVAAVERGTWTAAAESLDVSASAFSQGLAELEKRLGLVLFDKEGRRRVATSEAETAATYAKRVLAELGAMQRWAYQSREGDVGQIRAGMIDTAAVHHFGDALVRFGTLHPELAVRLTVRPSAQLFEMLSLDELDVVIAVAPDDDTGLNLRSLVAEPLYVYASPGSSFGPPETWGPWVTFPVESRTRSLVARALSDAGASFDVVAESSQPAVLREMVRLGMGWTVLAAVDAEREPHALRRALERPVAERLLTLAHRLDRRPTAALERFIAMLLGAATIDEGTT